VDSLLGGLKVGRSRYAKPGSATAEPRSEVILAGVAEEATEASYTDAPGSGA
jgi:hypothetical protein